MSSVLENYFGEKVEIKVVELVHDYSLSVFCDCYYKAVDMCASAPVFVTPSVNVNDERNGSIYVTVLV